MSADAETYPPPNEPATFESLCLDLWKDIWEDPGAQKNGRSGQAQAGVDVFGVCRGRQMGVQCKQKDGLLRTKVTVGELEREVGEALAFRPRLDTFILATSGSRDARVQARAREITEDHRGRGLFKVEVWSWTDIWHEIYGREALLRRILPIYWPRRSALESASPAQAAAAAAAARPGPSTSRAEDVDRLLRRIVRVEARFEKTARLAAGRKRGTGFRLAPGQVLTAQHVVERGHRAKAIERAAEIRVLLDEDGSGEQVVEETATVAWTGEDRLDPTDPKALDAALLKDDLPPGDLEPFRHWIDVPLGSSGCWETEGYAAASADVDPLAREYLWGTCHPARQGATYLQLTVERETPLPGKDGSGASWAGVSGGPVFVKEGRYRGHLYGIVRQSPRRFPDALYAVGTPALQRNAGLRQILGFKESVPPHPGLVEKLREELEQNPVLARRLAGLDDAWRQRFDKGGNDGLVDVLCNEGRLGPAVENLRRLYGRGDKKSASAQQIRKVAMALVPILAGKELPGGEALTAESARRIHLGTASPNFAEALLASAYGTPCLYDNPTGRDVPQACLRVPATVLEAGIHADSQVAEQLEELLMALMEEDLGTSPFMLPAQRALLSRASGGPRQELLRDLLRRRLRRIEQDRGRPAYLAAGEEEHRWMGDHLGTFLDRLARVLPNLDLVELETGSDQIAEAIDQEDQLWPLWEILDLLPE